MMNKVYCVDMAKLKAYTCANSLCVNDIVRLIDVRMMRMEGLDCHTWVVCANMDRGRVRHDTTENETEQR